MCVRVWLQIFVALMVSLYLHKGNAEETCLHDQQSDTVNDRVSLPPCEGVETYFWNEEQTIQKQLSFIYANARPIKIVNAPHNALKAIQKWSKVEYMKESVDTLTDVFVTASDEPFVYNVKSEPAIVAERLGLASSKVKSRITMSSFRFLESQNETSFYYSMSLSSAEMKVLRRDLDFSNLLESESTSSEYIMMAQNGKSITTGFQTRNLFRLQITGESRTWLFPSSCWKGLKFSSSLLFSRKQSQWKEFGFGLAERLETELASQVICVSLKPNDMLFVPPFVSYGVEILRPYYIHVDASISSHQENFEAQILSKNAIAPPVLHTILLDNPEQYSWAVSYFLQEVVQSSLQTASSCRLLNHVSDISSSTLNEILQTVVVHRLERLGLCEDFDRSKCPQGLALGMKIDPVTRTALDEVVQQFVQSVQDYSKLEHKCLQEGALELLLLDWVEALLTHSIGINKSCLFLKCIIHSSKQKTVTAVS